MITIINKNSFLLRKENKCKWICAVTHGGKSNNVVIGKIMGVEETVGAKVGREAAIQKTMDLWWTPCSSEHRKQK